jgi:hypothetical protein
MGFFSKLFGQDDGQRANIQAAIRSEIDIGECVVAHMKWKGRLQSYVEGTSEEMLDPMVICRDDQCALGKWIHGPALTYFHSDKSFHQLRSNHAQFHFVAGNVVKMVQENNRKGAEGVLSSEYARVSRNVIRDLGELNKHLEDG